MSPTLNLTLDNLNAWITTGRPADDMPPARLAVIGDPVAHSRSPAMHQPALDDHDLDMRYVRLHVKPGDVAKAFSAMQVLGFIGCNVTVPHKLEALNACNSVDTPATLFQAVNTVKFLPDGTSTGTNTDGRGLAAAVAEAFGKPLANHRVAILGAGGGAGRAAALQCALLKCPNIVLANRTLAKAAVVAEEISRISPKTTVSVSDLSDGSDRSDHDQLARALTDCDLLINATTVGMKPDEPSSIPISLLRPDLAVYDMIYNPPETPLLAAARAIGAPTANGLSMLIHQGALAFSFWFDCPPPVDIMRKVLVNV